MDILPDPQHTTSTPRIKVPGNVRRWRPGAKKRPLHLTFPNCKTRRSMLLYVVEDSNNLVKLVGTEEQTPKEITVMLSEQNLRQNHSSKQSRWVQSLVYCTKRHPLSSVLVLLPAFIPFLVHHLWQSVSRCRSCLLVSGWRQAGRLGCCSLWLAPLPAIPPSSSTPPSIFNTCYVCILTFGNSNSSATVTNERLAGPVSSILTPTVRRTDPLWHGGFARRFHTMTTIIMSTTATSLSNSKPWMVPSLTLLLHVSFFLVAFWEDGCMYRRIRIM